VLTHSFKAFVIRYWVIRHWVKSNQF